MTSGLQRWALSPELHKATSRYAAYPCASQLGIAPALQILRGVLGDKRGSVEMELLWLNENERDFVCEEEIEELEYKHIEKLAVSRMVEDLYAAGFARVNSFKIRSLLTTRSAWA